MRHLMRRSPHSVSSTEPLEEGDQPRLLELAVEDLRVLARDSGADEPSPIRPRAQPDPHGKPEPEEGEAGEETK